MKNISKLWLPALCLALILLPLTALAGPGDTPKETAQAYIAAFKEFRLSDAAKMMHPASLAKFRKLTETAVGAAKESGQEMKLLAMFDGVKSVAELEKLDDLAFFTAFMKGTLGRSEEAKASMAAKKESILGVVEDGPDGAHAVVKTVFPDGNEKVELVSLKKDGEVWKVTLVGQIGGPAR